MLLFEIQRTNTAAAEIPEAKQQKIESNNIQLVIRISMVP
jgi:hypothetical protein